VQADRERRELRGRSASYARSWRRSPPSARPPYREARLEKAHGGDQRVDDLRARHQEENRQLGEELAELRGELTTAHQEARVQRSRADRAEARLDNATVAAKARRRQTYAGRGRRRDEVTATGTETTGQ
jgi:colicin import membrane protein